MKRIIMLFFVLIFLFNAKNVFAQDQYHLTLEKQDGIYMSRRGVNYNDDSYPYYIYKMDGMFAYCIEPGKHITTYTYIGQEEYVDLDFSEELKEKLELIGYYGREYPGHNNVRYSMAAQALIWELTGVDTVTFWTKQYEQGEEIDISQERNEIMNLVNNHKTLPNFKNNYNGYFKKEMNINDTNNVLDNYEIESAEGQNVEIIDNSIHITPQKLGKFKIILRRKNYDEYNTIIFVGKGDNSSQKLGRLHFNKEIKSEITINVSGINLLIHKTDENNNPILINNIQFQLKNINTGKYVCKGHNDCIYKTDNNGELLIESLDFGEYELEEVENQIVKGYTWNKEKLYIKLDETTSYNWDEKMHNYLDVYFKNNSVYIAVEITKTGEEAVFKNNTISYTENKLSNIYFDLYTKDNQYVNTGITDENGIAMIGNLKLGKYYLIERTELDNYIEQNKIPFMISQNSQYQESIICHLNVKNELKKGILEFIKVDSKTNKGIANTIIEIYDNDSVLLFTKETDIDGKITIENLPKGKYFIKEKEANYYYEKTDEIVPFEIKDNGEIVKVEMRNNKMIGKIEIKKMGELYKNNDNNPSYEEVPLKDIEFELFNEKNELVDILKTNDDGYASRNLELGKYYLIEKKQLNTYKDNNEKYYFEIKKDNNKVINAKLVINNYLKKGGVEFKKEEFITLNGIDNTIMEIYNQDGKLLLTRKTDINGKIVINNLPLGKYYFKEKEANYYYKKTDELVPFEIKSDGEVVKVSLVNQRIVGDLEIYKLGENYHFINNEIVYDNKPLHGINFAIYDNSNNLIGNIITDKNGYAKYSDLPIGKYYLIEKTNLNDYINDEKYYFEIKKGFDNNGINIKLEIVNYLKKSDLEFTKEDLATGNGIANTIIEIYNDMDMLLFTRETNEYGKIVINNLPLGKYYIKEKEANYYYKKTDELVPFEIKNDGEVVKVSLVNQRIVGDLEIYKLGENYHFINNEIVYDNKPLQGINFAIYDNSNNLIGNIITDKNGYAKYSDLPIGKYYLIEKTNLNDYINDEKYYFEIKKGFDNNGINIKLEIVNYLKKSDLEFTKEDLVTGNGIPNTIIEIYNDMDMLLFTRETDEYGKIVINNLPLGKYYIIEKEANSMYMITNEKVYFEVKENGEIIKAKMTNEKIEIPVYKTNTNEKIIANSILGIVFLIGIGRRYYEKKESY